MFADRMDSKSIRSVEHDRTDKHGKLKAGATVLKDDYIWSSGRDTQRLSLPFMIARRQYLSPSK
jgi:hypothetical protein